MNRNNRPPIATSIGHHQRHSAPRAATRIPSVWLIRSLGSTVLGFAFASTAEAQTPILTVPGTAGESYFGDSTAGIGDIDGDGYGDVVVGAYLSNLNNTANGSVSVFSGKTGARLWQTSGMSYNAQMGTCVAALGDVNGDGKPDFLVGAPGEVNPANNQATGMVGIISGAYVYSQTGPQYLMKKYGEASGDLFGQAVVSLGDLDGDGKPDFAVGAPGVSASSSMHAIGRVYVYSGATGNLIFSYSGQPTQSAGDELGWSLARLPDITGDGKAELLVGVPYDDTNAVDAGAVHVLSGANGAFLGAVYGTGSGDHFGWSVAGGGDVTGDGVPDFVVGAPRRSQAGVQAGWVTLYSGATLALPVFQGVPFPGFPGSAPGALAGTSVSMAADVNQDGTPDIAVGEPAFSGGGASQNGRVSLYSGHDRTLMGAIPGPFNYGNFGAAVAIVPGIQSGPYAELVVGATTVGADGTVYVYSGSYYATYVYCAASANSAGAGAHIGSNGSVSIATNNFTLSTTGCPPTVFALYFYSATQISPVPFGNGVRCIGTPLVRLPVIQSSANGVAAYTLNFGALPSQGQIHPGDSRDFQLWYRDPSAGGAAFNASNALNATFLP
jgi:hypothetical protein